MAYRLESSSDDELPAATEAALRQLVDSAIDMGADQASIFAKDADGRVLCVFLVVCGASSAFAAQIDLSGDEPVVYSAEVVRHGAGPDIDLSDCPYFRRYVDFPGADPNGTCNRGCHDEPRCVTEEPASMWPGARLHHATAELTRAQHERDEALRTIDEILGVCEGSPSGGAFIINDIADLARRAKSR